jgi:hypothetical protein
MNTWSLLIKIENNGTSLNNIAPTLVQLEDVDKEKLRNHISSLVELETLYSSKLISGLSSSLHHSEDVDNIIEKSAHS